MMRLCEYSIRDYYGVSNIFYYFFRLDITHNFSHIIAVFSGSDFRQRLSLRTM